MGDAKRKKLFVDRDVQGGLLQRLLVYWVSCMLFVTLPPAILLSFYQPTRHLLQHYLDTVWQHWPVLVALTAILPFFFFDAIRFSHRFAGPISRVRREMAAYARGEDAFPLEFRRGDFWRDLIDQINALVERVEAAESKAAHAEAPSTPLRDRNARYRSISARRSCARLRIIFPGAEGTPENGSVTGSDPCACC